MRKTRDLFGKLKAQRKSVADVGHQRHETRAFDGGGDSVLADGRATGLAAANDFALATGQFFEKLDVFVIDKERMRPLPFNFQRVLFLNVDLGLGAFAIDAILFECRGFGHSYTN